MEKREKFLSVEVDYPEAKEWADIVSLTNDIDSTIQICDRLIHYLAATSEDRIIIESLWTTALIKYARCFTSGKRFGLSRALFDGLNGDPHGAHEYFINIRSKHIAHSINPFEQVTTGLVLSDPETEKKAAGTVTFSQWHISATGDGVQTLKNLCFVLRAKLSETGKDLYKKVLKIGQQLNIGELYSKAELKTTTPGPYDAGKAREE